MSFQHKMQGCFVLLLVLLLIITMMWNDASPAFLAPCRDCLSPVCSTDCDCHVSIVNALGKVSLGSGDNILSVFAKKACEMGRNTPAPRFVPPSMDSPLRESNGKGANKSFQMLLASQKLTNFPISAQRNHQALLDECRCIEFFNSMFFAFDHTSPTSIMKNDVFELCKAPLPLYKGRQAVWIWIHQGSCQTAAPPSHPTITPNIPTSTGQRPFLPYSIGFMMSFGWNSVVEKTSISFAHGHTDGLMVFKRDKSSW